MVGIVIIGKRLVQIWMIFVCLPTGSLTDELTLKDMKHDHLCIGDTVNVACSNGTRIDLISGFFVYVHNVSEANSSNCHIHYNASAQCMRKVQHYDNAYFRELVESCHNKPSCDGNVIAKVGDPHACWDFPHSATDYLTLSYYCRSASHPADSPTSSPRVVTTNKPPGSTSQSGYSKLPASTSPSGLTRRAASTRPSGSTVGQSRSPASTRQPGSSNPRFLLTTSGLLPRTYSTNQHTRFLSSSTTTSVRTAPVAWWMTRYWRSTTQKNTHSTRAYRSTERPPNTSPGHVVESSAVQNQPLSGTMMIVAVVISVLVMLAAIITIAAVIAFRTPKKRSGIVRRLSENSSVYYSNSNSPGGSTLRGSINGISNPGFQVLDKQGVKDADSCRIVLDPAELSTKPDLPDIHINPAVSHASTNQKTGAENVYANEPLSEQVFTEVSERC